ncbi:hypothetical protein ACHAQJ_006220 [Trichoderma viride]
MRTDGPQFWTDNDEFLMSTLMELTNKMEVGDLEKWLTMGEQVIRDKMEADLEEIIGQVEVEDVRRKEAQPLKAKVEQRKKQYKSDELIQSTNAIGIQDQSTSGVKKS